MTNGNAGASQNASNERVSTVNALRVWTPGHRRAMTLLKRCIEEPYAAEPRSLFIGGESGVGKSTLMEEFESMYPRVAREPADEVPVLLVKIPSVATTKGTASACLKKFGDPRAFQGELARLTDRLLQFIKACTVRIVVLDEFQHVIDRESQKVRARTADWVKEIIDGAGIPVVLVGLPKSERILTENHQLDSRFPRRTLIDVFRWDTTASRAEFRKLLKHIDSGLPFDTSAGLSDLETAAWLYERSNGILRPLMNLIRVASEEAISRGSSSLTLDDLKASAGELRGISGKGSGTETAIRRPIGEVFRA